MCAQLHTQTRTRMHARQVALLVKNPPAKAGDARDAGAVPVCGRSPGGGHGNPLVFLSGEPRGQRSLVCYSPQDCRESDTTEVT